VIPLLHTGLSEMHHDRALYKFTLLHFTSETKAKDLTFISKAKHMRFMAKNSFLKNFSRIFQDFKDFCQLIVLS